MKHTKSYIPKYPRPQLVRKNWLDLSGEWDFMFTDSYEQTLDGFISEDFDRIVVPYSYHTKKSRINNQFYHPYMVYRKQVQINLEPDQRIIIHFEAVDYESALYVNNKKVGKHTGGYNRFSFDISDYVKNGYNTLLLYVSDDMSKEKPRGKQRYKTENFECWYIETSGIWKTPWLEMVPKTYVRELQTYVSDSHIEFDLAIEDFQNNDTVKVIISDGSRIVETTQANSAKIAIKFSEKIQKWSFDDPKLYDIDISIERNGTVIDQVKSYFGLRDISCHTSFKINEQDTFLKMILNQGYYGEDHLTAGENEILRDLELIKEMGFNGIRMHEKIESELFNYYCDVLGIYTWQEMPSFYEYTELAKSRFLREYQEMLQQFRNHPSIVVWVPFNESWGIYKVYDDSDQQEFVKQVYHLTKKIDPTRPVISNDGWEHLHSDIITIHNYDQDWRKLKKNLSIINKQEEITNTFSKKTYAKGYSYHNQAIMISEYAGIAFSNTEGWGYGQSVNDEAEFVERLSNLTRTIVNDSQVSGYCVTQYTDVQQEMNGLLDEERIPKTTIKNYYDINHLVDKKSL